MATAKVQKKPDGNGKVNEAIEKVLGEQHQEAEEAKLEREMASIEDSADVNALPDLADSGLQRINALLDEFKTWDSQRHTNKVKTEIAKEAGDVEGAKNLIAAKPNILKHLNIVVKKLVATLATEEDVREEMVNWLSMPYNLRTLLAARLRDLHATDVSSLVKRATDIEDERRRLRRLTKQTP